jgi:hypothetical protein
LGMQGKESTNSYAARSGNAVGNRPEDGVSALRF